MLGTSKEPLWKGVTNAEMPTRELLKLSWPRKLILLIVLNVPLGCWPLYAPLAEHKSLAMGWKMEVIFFAALDVRGSRA